MYVYAPSKTGTTSVKNALVRAGIQVVRIHYLHPESIELEKETIENFYIPVGVEGHLPHMNTISNKLKYRDDIIRGDPKIITVKRNMLDRQISRFFNNIGKMYVDYTNLTMKELYEDFKGFCHYQDNLYENYWDREYLKGAFTVDIDNINNNALSKFVGRKVEVLHERKASEDYYAVTYKRFKYYVSKKV